jgi:hypothetical protein
MRTRRPTLIVVVALAFLATACGGGSGGDSTAMGTVTLRVVAGPVCPVETNPPNPACAPHPVKSARVVLEGPASVSVDVHDGSATVDLPPGTYQVVPKPAPGLMGPAPQTSVRVVAGAVTPLRLLYDTGIR